MAHDVTTDTLYATRDQILREMKEGFAGMHARQDKTNGRIDKTEDKVSAIAQSLAGHEVQLRTLEQDSIHFHRRSTDPPASVAAGSDRTLTRDDLKIVALIMAGTVSAVLGLIALIREFASQVAVP